MHDEDKLAAPAERVRSLLLRKQGVTHVCGMGRRSSARFCKAEPGQREAEEEEEEEEEEEDGAEDVLEAPAGRSKRQRVDGSAAGSPVTAWLHSDGLSRC